MAYQKSYYMLQGNTREILHPEIIIEVRAVATARLSKKEKKYSIPNLYDELANFLMTNKDLIGSDISYLLDGDQPLFSVDIIYKAMCRSDRNRANGATLPVRNLLCLYAFKLNWEKTLRKLKLGHTSVYRFSSRINPQEINFKLYTIDNSLKSVNEGLSLIVNKIITPKSKIDKNNLDDLFRKYVNALYNSDRYKKATEILEKILKKEIELQQSIESTLSDILFGLYKCEKYNEIITSANSFLKRLPNRYSIYRLKVEAYIKLGQLHNALDTINSALMSDPEVNLLSNDLIKIKLAIYHHLDGCSYISNEIIDKYAPGVRIKFSNQADFKKFKEDIIKFIKRISEEKVLKQGK